MLPTRAAGVPCILCLLLSCVLSHSHFHCYLYTLNTLSLLLVFFISVVCIGFAAATVGIGACCGQRRTKEEGISQKIVALPVDCLEFIPNWIRIVERIISITYQRSKRRRRPSSSTARSIISTIITTLPRTAPP